MSEEIVIDLIRADTQRMDMLHLVQSLNLPDWYIAAGFVRNLIWDYLHGYSSTELNDVDVIFFDKSTALDNRRLEVMLNRNMLDVRWEVKNQSRMHCRNGDQPYESSLDAMSYWPEKETALGVRLDDGNNLMVESPFSIAAVFNGFISHNPKRARSVFDSRVSAKKWLEIWPKLTVFSE